MQHPNILIDFLSLLFLFGMGCFVTSVLFNVNFIKGTRWDFWVNLSISLTIGANTFTGFAYTIPYNATKPWIYFMTCLWLVIGGVVSYQMFKMFQRNLKNEKSKTISSVS